MNIRERYLAAYNHQPVDRVPVALSYYHARFSRKHFPRALKGQDPIERQIENQLRYGFDPHAYVRGTADWQLARPNAGEEPPEYAAASDEWRVTQATTHLPTGALCTDYCIETPGGTLRCIRVQEPDDFGTIEEPFIKQERDIELLRYRPHPRTIVNADLIRQDARTMGDRCWAMASITGVWGLASFLRGPVRIMYDCYDRPQWVKRFLGVLGDYQVELVKAIGAAGADLTLRIDGSFIGFGLSRAMFVDFIQPDDARIVQAAHDAGMRVHFHICGKKNAFLEDLAGMGIDALETLTPPSAAGDVDLADAKRRIGGRVCLMGGFLSHTLTFGTVPEVEAEVRRCLERAAPGGGYILSPSGRIDPETPEENLFAFTRAGRGMSRSRQEPASRPLPSDRPTP
jgi:uroporphyrinogen decarboxylase